MEVVIGGEGFNADLRAAIGARAAELEAVVLLAHTAAGARHWQVQRYFSTSHGLPVVRSVHSLDGPGEVQAARGGRGSSRSLRR